MITKGKTNKLHYSEVQGYVLWPPEGTNTNNLLMTLDLKI